MPRARKPPAEDPRIAALGDSRLAALARVLLKGPLARGELESLVEYLDYIDHARYTPDEIAGFLDALVTRGLARRDGDTWHFLPASSSS